MEDLDGDRLTPREREVCTLAVKRQTDAQIARELNISVRTVHAHLRSVYIKLGIKTRRDLPGREPLGRDISCLPRRGHSPQGTS